MQRTILVTGGNRGIGLATCKTLAKLGHKVLLGCRNLKGGSEIANSIGPHVHAVLLDLSDPEHVALQLERILQRHARIDGLINNAAILKNGGIMEVNPKDFYQSFATNLFAPYELCRILAPVMIRQGYGRIVNVSSGWGAFSAGLEGPAAYAVSKAALNALTLSLSRELSDNVKVNAMDPGWVKTAMGGNQAPTSPEKAAETAVYLVDCDESGPNGEFWRDKKPVPW